MLLDARAVRGVGGGAPVDATFITQTPNATLTNEQALSALATGILKSTTATGVVSIASQGVDYYAPGGTDVAIADGGTGQSTAQAAIDALTNVAAATDEHVLTKDTVTGNAIFKAAAGGSSLPVVDETAIAYQTGQPTRTLTFDLVNYTAARVLTPPNADATIAGLEVANVFTQPQDILRNFSGSEGDNLLNIISVWDTSATCRGLSFTITNIASNASSALFEMIEGSNVIFKLYTTGAFDCQARSSGITNDGRSTANRISIINPDTTVNNYSAIRFGDSNSDVSAWIAARHIDHGNNYSDLFLGTRGADGAVVRMVITSAGRIGIGDRLVLPLAKLHIDQPSTTGAIPVLALDQADLSEEFIRFISTVGAGNPIDTAALGAYYGKVRVYVEGVGAKWLALYD